MRLAIIVLFCAIGTQSFAAGFGSRKLCNIPFAIIGQVRAAVVGAYPGQQTYLASPGGAPGPELRVPRYYAALAKYGVFRAFRLRKPHVDWSSPREVADFYEWLSGQEQFLFFERPEGAKNLSYRAQAYQNAVYAKIVLEEAAAELRESADKQEAKDAVLKKSRAMADAPEGSPEKAYSVALTKFADPKELTAEEKRARLAFTNAAPSGVAEAVHLKILAEYPEPRTPAQEAIVRKKYQTLVEPLLRREAPLGVLVRSLGDMSGMIALHTPKSQSLGKDLPRTAYRSADGLLSVTFQQMPGGLVRVEAMRVGRADQPPETYVAEWYPAKNRFEEKDHKTENNCFSCHAVTPGRIDFRAQNMRGAAQMGKSARELAMKIAKGENPDLRPQERAKEDTEKVMKKLKVGSAESRELEAWIKALAN